MVHSDWGHDGGHVELEHKTLRHLKSTRPDVKNLLMAEENTLTDPVNGAELTKPELP